MRQERWGPTGAFLPVIGQGTWNLERHPRRAAVAAIRAGIDGGMTHIDTAEMYGDGRVEEILAEALAGRRDQVYLVSKVLPSNASRDGTSQACERSLKRLATDRLDLYLLHWPGSHPLEDTIAAFEELVEAGKIRAWGVSNFDVPDLERALAVAGPGRMAANQVLYHLEERAIEHRVAPWCAAHGLALVAYSPLGCGAFPAPASAGGRVLAEVGRAHGASAAQVALAFLVRAPGAFAIPKAVTPAHVHENARAGSLRLTREDVARIERAFPRGAPGPLPML